MEGSGLKEEEEGDERELAEETPPPKKSAWWGWCWWWAEPRKLCARSGGVAAWPSSTNPFTAWISCSLSVLRRVVSGRPKLWGDRLGLEWGGGGLHTMVRTPPAFPKNTLVPGRPELLGFSGRLGGLSAVRCGEREEIEEEEPEGLIMEDRLSWVDAPIMV